MGYVPKPIVCIWASTPAPACSPLKPSRLLLRPTPTFSTPGHTTHADMFPTFDALPPHETVGARKARKEREENNTARRASTSTSLSSGSSVKDTKPAGRSAFGFFSKSKDKQIQEIPTQKKDTIRQPEPESQPDLESSFAPSITPSAPTASDWGSALETTHHDAYRRQIQQPYQPPPQSSYQDRPRQPSYQEHQSPSSLKPTYPSPPPLGALPPPPSSTSGSSRSASKCAICIVGPEKTWPPWKETLFGE